MQSYITTAWQMFGVIIVLISVDSKSLQPEKEIGMQTIPRHIGIFTYFSRLTGEQSCCWNSSRRTGEGKSKEQSIWFQNVKGRKQDGERFFRTLSSGKFQGLLKQVLHLCFEKTILATQEMNQKQRKPLGGCLQIQQVRPETLDGCGVGNLGR